MPFLPLQKMKERVLAARSDSDSLFFENLLYYGEMVTKIIALGLAAAVSEDRHRQRYRIAHRLVRADGIGEWAQAIADVLKGPSAEHLFESAREEQRELTQRLRSGSWQFDSVALLHGIRKAIDPALEDLPAKVDALRWFTLFAEIRNKSRGHGALRSDLHIKLCEPLEASIEALVSQHRLFTRPWAYLHRNLSGKYRVTSLSDSSGEFNQLKSASGGDLPALNDGVYIHFGLTIPSPVPLVYSSVDAVDFFLPNGAFDSSGFETLSYITGDTEKRDSSPYMLPAEDLPASETQGLGNLDIQGKCFGNIPSPQTGYVRRTTLEERLYESLKDDRHPVITLPGRGGIGKTWLALNVLHSLSQEETFEAILWFSARDIDLLSSGPKVVTPHVLTEEDMAKEFVRLMDPSGASEKGFRAIEYFASALTKSPTGKPFLFVFDNFETVRSPAELYRWLDTYVRLPNKVLITTRVRDFKADYPVTVSGMSEAECKQLIRTTAATLGVASLLTQDYVNELISESEGHPYVIKVLLGETAKAGRVGKVERIIASREEILDALFERTYTGLSLAARRVFLTLCGWRSSVAQLAIEAVLLQSAKERIDVAGAIEELQRSSFVEIMQSKEDGQLFVTVPLVAALFGRRKLEVSPMKIEIQSDMPLLIAFGATQPSAADRGLWPKLDRFFRKVASDTTKDPEKLPHYVPMLEFIAKNYPAAWKLLASLYEELNLSDASKRSDEALRRYLETSPSVEDRRDTWKRIAVLCQRSSDVLGEMQAHVEISQLPGVPFHEISNSANRLNQLFVQSYLTLDSELKKVLIEQLASVMEARIGEGDSTDCSRLAWLFLNAHNAERAKCYVAKGLELDSDNNHCLKLEERLQRDIEFRNAHC